MRPQVSETEGLVGFGWSIWVVTFCPRLAEQAKVGVLELVGRTIRHSGSP
jgi:hypothetical protein